MVCRFIRVKLFVVRIRIEFDLLLIKIYKLMSLLWLIA